MSTEAFTPNSPFDHRITPHITVGEFALQQPARRFQTIEQCRTATQLAQFLETVRAHFGGRPLIITSGYRPPAVNQNTEGAASGSEHLYNAPGKGAVDFRIQGVSPYVVQDYCDAQWSHSVGYGAHLGFVHVGMRPGRSGVRWNY